LQPGSVIPKLDDVNTLISLGTKGNILVPNPGMSISIDGAETTGGLVGYTEASATPSVSTL
jgi:hypothetical protein